MRQSQFNSFEKYSYKNGMKKHENKAKRILFFDIYLKQGIEMDGFFLIQNDQATNKKTPN